MNHFYQTVPGWASFRQFYIDAVAEASSGSHFVEVGCWHGKSAAFMAVEIINSGKSIRFDCVDLWLDGGPDLRHKAVTGLYESFLRHTASVRHVVRPVRMDSVEASKKYADGSLDFVMIDASHVYEDAIADIRAWSPKVKAGGVLAGDDYGWPGVRMACDEFFGREVGDGPPGRTVPKACWRVRM